MDVRGGTPFVQRCLRVSLDGLQPVADVEHALEFEQQAGSRHRWQRTGVHTASVQSGALTGRAWMTGSRWPPASAASALTLHLRMMICGAAGSYHCGGAGAE